MPFTDELVSNDTLIPGDYVQTLDRASYGIVTNVQENLATVKWYTDDALTMTELAPAPLSSLTRFGF
jgi:hypothetical protein